MYVNLSKTRRNFGSTRLVATNGRGGMSAPGGAGGCRDFMFVSPAWVRGVMGDCISLLIARLRKPFLSFASAEPIVWRCTWFEAAVVWLRVVGRVPGREVWAFAVFVILVGSVVPAA